MTQYQKEWLELLQQKKRLNISAFRSSGKTEMLFVDYPIHQMFTKAGWDGICLSSSLRQAKEIIKRVKDRVIDNELLRTSIPSNKSMSWSKTEIMLKNGSRYVSLPANENLRGGHVNFIGGDELGEWKNWDIVTKTIPPMTLAKDGQIVFVGTPTSEIDFIHKLAKIPAYETRWYPANAKTEEGKILWELRYPDISINVKRREYDSLSWSREFLLKPLSSSDQIFPYKLIEPCFNYDLSFEVKSENRVPYFMGMDFALSGEAGADYTVMTVLKKQEDKIAIADICRYKGLAYQAQKIKARELFSTYKPLKIVADEGTFGKSFIADMLADHMPVEGFRFTNQSKQDLITNLRRVFEQQEIVVPRDKLDIRTNQQVDLLIKELGAFGVSVDETTGRVRLEGIGSHDDMVFSLALAVYAARGFGAASFEIRRRSRSGIRAKGLIRRI